MDYRNLPPGRSRRLIYSINLENRRRIIPQTPIQQTLSIISFRQIINISPVQTLNFSQLGNLESVKLGLINKNLVVNSKILKNNKKDCICIICQEIIETEDIIREIKCNHSFHINCIDTWLSENKKCPLCKFLLE